MLNLCKVEDCTKQVFGHGLCNMHYLRVRKHGSIDALQIIPNDGLWKTPEYKSYHAMKYRIFGKAFRQKKDYADRGITICDRWLGPYGFLNFYEDMGKKPTPKHTLDRIDNDGSYEPGNCRWATMSVQRINSRNPKRGFKKGVRN